MHNNTVRGQMSILATPITNTEMLSLLYYTQGYNQGTLTQVAPNSLDENPSW